MNMATLVLQVLLGLVFLPLSFLALRQHETDGYGAFLVASGPFASSAVVLASQKLREKCDRAAPTETTATDIEGLNGCGFTTEEIVSLLWLQHWYQTGGSDRVEPLRQWEFLKYLVLNDKLSR